MPGLNDAGRARRGSRITARCVADHLHRSRRLRSVGDGTRTSDDGVLNRPAVDFVRLGRWRFLTRAGLTARATAGSGNIPGRPAIARSIARAVVAHSDVAVAFAVAYHLRSRPFSFCKTFLSFFLRKEALQAGVVENGDGMPRSARIAAAAKTGRSSAIAARSFEHTAPPEILSTRSARPSENVSVPVRK